MSNSQDGNSSEQNWSDIFLTFVESKIHPLYYFVKGSVLVFSDEVARQDFDNVGHHFASFVPSTYNYIYKM